MSQVLPNERISTVAAEITNAFRSIVAKDQDRREARDVYQSASNDATNVRESLLIKLAEIAAGAHWSQYETEQGIDKAISQRNDSKDNSIKTFASEIKRACHPNARQHVRALAELANTVWDNETAQDKKLPRPCRDAFARKYHLLQRMIGEAVDSKRVLETSHDVVSFAMAHDPTKNPERAFKKFKALRDGLGELAEAFPLDEILNAVESIHDLALADFKHPGERVQKSSAATAGRDETGSEGVDSGEENDASETEPETEPAMGVSDLLDEALKDIAA